MSKEDLYDLSRNCPASVEKTIVLVKEKAWSFRNALRSVAKVLVGIGAASPEIIGYSAVETREEDYVKKKDEGEEALRSVIEHERDLNPSHFRDYVVSAEESSLVYHQVEEQGISHGFVEAMNKTKDERKSLVSPRHWEEIEEDKALV